MQSDLLTVTYRLVYKSENAKTYGGKQIIYRQKCIPKSNFSIKQFWKILLKILQQKIFFFKFSKKQNLSFLILSQNFYLKILKF